MIRLSSSKTFRAWIEGLRDLRVRTIIAARLERIQAGNFGNVRSLGAGLSELKIDYGPGYRIYFIRRGGLVVILLCGGDKSSQDRDIRLAQTLAKQAQEDPDVP